MPPRVNLTILLGLVIVIVFSFGLSASAQPDDERQGGEEQVLEPGEDSAGVVPEDDAIKEARGELERLQWEVQAAHGARLNADEEKRQVADDIVGTQNELAAAKEHRAKTEGELANTASEVYRNRGLEDLLGVLLGAGTFKDFAGRLDLAVRLLTEKREAVEQANEAEDKLTKELEERRGELQEWETTVTEQETLEERISQAEADVRDYLDSLDEGVREEIEADRARQAELDRARGMEILQKLAENESPGVTPELTTPPPAVGKLDELRGVELEAEQKAAEKVAEAEQARLAAEQQAEQGIEPKAAAGPSRFLVIEPQAEPKAEGDPKATEPEVAGQQANQAEQARLDAERAAMEAEQAATEAAKQAKAAEEARRLAERDAVGKQANPPVAATKAAGRKVELPIEVSDDADGVVNGGDRLRVEGDFGIKPGASVTFQDADGTRGTAIDGVNAQIRKGSIDTLVTGPLDNVTGGDGVLDTTGKLELVDANGIDTGLGGVPLGQDATGAAGFQYGDDPIIGVGGLQYTDQPLVGAGGLQGDPVTSAGGLQPKAPVASSGQPGLQPTASAPATGPISGPAIVAEAMGWLGTPYSYGGTSRSGISCSGLVMMVYGKFGISLPNSPEGILGVVSPLKTGPAPPGAVVFFTENGSGSPTHVGISNGDGTMTDANVVKGMVGITPIDVVPGYMGWGFPPGV